MPRNRGGPPAPADDLGRPGDLSARILAILTASVGLLERDSAGEHGVPEALRGVLARALLLASSMLLPDDELLEE